MSDTDFDIGAFGLHELTDDFAELVGIRELSGSCRRWKGRFRARRRGHALHGIHVMETAAESGDLLRTLQKKRGKKRKKMSVSMARVIKSFIKENGNVHKSRATNIRKQMPLSTYCCAHIHDCTATEPGKRQ